MRLTLIDFRNIPDVLTKHVFSVTNPYFYDFMDSLRRRLEPPFERVHVWLMICEDKTQLIQVAHYVENNSVLTEYNMVYSVYIPAKFERLGDYATNNSKAKTKVNLIFLQKKSNVRQINIPEYFCPLDSIIYTKPRKYNKLEYRIHNNEL